MTDSEPSIAQSLDLESIPGQIGTAIIRASAANLSQKDHPQISCTGEMTEKDAGIMYSILLEIGTVLSPPPNMASTKTQPNGKENEITSDATGCEALKKFNVSFPSVQYSCCVSSTGCVYIVKRRSP